MVAGAEKPLTPNAWQWANESVTRCGTLNEKNKTLKHNFLHNFPGISKYTTSRSLRHLNVQKWNYLKIRHL